MLSKLSNIILSKIYSRLSATKRSLKRLVNKLLVSIPPLRFYCYRVRAGIFDKDGIEKWCKEVNQYYAKQGDLLSEFTVYEKVVNSLITSPGVDICAMSDLMTYESNKAIVALRHDVDADVNTALKAAKFLSENSVPGSFYLLHTATYYGYFEDYLFHRQPGMKYFVKELVKTGCEIGLHTDPLSIYCEHNTNGEEAVVKEIKWMRSQGAHICGTVAHNSAPLYGAENFEVFKNRALADRDGFIYKGKKIPLQVIDESKLGIKYEGNYPILSPDMDSQELRDYLSSGGYNGIRDLDWQQQYFINNPVFSRPYDVSIWLLASDSWVIAIHKSPGQVRWPVKTDAVIEFIGSLTPGERVVINIHPEYIAA